MDTKKLDNALKRMKKRFPKPKETGSEFGKGFIYSLVLFACHMDSAMKIIEEYSRVRSESKGDIKGLFAEDRALSLWANGATDHLYDMVLPKNLPVHLAKRIVVLRDEYLSYGHGEKMMCPLSWKKYNELRIELDSICMAIDRWLGLKPIKAMWR